MITVILFIISLFMICWPNVGYPVFILLLGKIIKRSNKKKNKDYSPTVTLMIVAHNEEKVIKEKLKNATSLDYPKDKYTILVTSDNSDDNTNKIVEDFIKNNKKYNIKLYKVKKRMGKTNAQNEAAKLVNSEILIMTDANSILDKKSIREIVSSFSSDDIAYVSGKLEYTNKNVSDTSNNETTYWDIETRIREIESNIQTITAGNGALYACKTSDYQDFDPINCHDSAMPLFYALNCKRAIANNHAIAYEKAGETDKDEFKRKVRMNRDILYFIFPSIKVINIFKYRWFPFFYFGHRISRYLLWFNHLLLLITNILLLDKGLLFIITLCIQIIIYLSALTKLVFNTNNKILNFCFYYCMTVFAQFVGVLKTLLGQNKPFWEKAESTR